MWDVAWYVLLARLEREHECALSGIVGGCAHNSAGELAHKSLRAADEAKIGASVAQRHAERLAVAHGNVGAPFARSLDDGEVGRNRVDH